MQFTPTEECLLYLVAKGLNSSVNQHDMSSVDWSLLLELSKVQGVNSILMDAINSSNDLKIQFDFNCKYKKFQWLGVALKNEKLFESQKLVMSELSEFFGQHNIRCLLLKGYGLSMNYPIPSHRPLGDIDVFLFGKGSDADQLMSAHYSILAKQNEDKHSTFCFKGISIENHASFVNEILHPCLKDIENFLEEESKSCIDPFAPNGSKIKNLFLPSVAANSIFIPLHTAEHFVRREANLRQLCDWFCFVSNYNKQIDWDLIEKHSKKSGFYDFICCLNGICIDFFGADPCWFPQWSRNNELECRILKDILSPKGLVKISLLSKVFRFFKSYWRYNLVYKDSFLLSSLRQAKAYSRVRWETDGVSIWKKRSIPIDL